MMLEKVIELKAIKESTADYEALEKRIKELFRELIYLPLIRELGEPKSTLKNAEGDDSALSAALRSGRVTFYRGTFSGKFNASISKELKQLGAQWDRKQGTWKVPLSQLPPEYRSLIAASEAKFEQKLASIDKKLTQLLPEEIAAHFSATGIFDRTLWKVNKSFEHSVKGITIAPKLSPEARKRIAEEWEKNLKLYIQKFTDEEILKLRANMKKSVFTGNRYESTIKTIQASYGVSANKAKFLARQETSLLMTKFKQTRYEEAGVREYKWVAVTGTKLHPTRPAHMALAEQSKKGKIFRWDQPPNTAAPGEAARYNNPGQDYNCRCTAIPIVRFKK